MENNYQPLASGEVLSVKEAVQFLIGHGTFRSGEFIEAFKEQLLEYNIGGLTEDKEAWFTDQGIECEVLRFGSSGWEKGFVRINLEFCPAEAATEPTAQSTQRPQAVTAAKPYEESTLDLDTLSSSEEEMEFGDDFLGESTEEFDLAEDLDLGEDFTSESTGEVEGDLDLNEEDLDLGEDFTSESTGEVEGDLDFGEELEDPFAAAPNSSNGKDFNFESFGEDGSNENELGDPLAFKENDFSGEYEENLGEELDLDLGLSEENKDDDLMDLDELETDEDFSFEDFSLGEGEGESEDVWQDQKV